MTTARLLLRPLSRDDFEAHYAVIGSDPQVTWQRQVHSRQQAQAALEHRIAHWEQHGFGMWAIIDRMTGHLLGHGGLQDLEQTGEIEVGYYLGRQAWGQGFGTEIGRAAIQYGFVQLKLPRIVAVVRPENQPSQRVLAKLGLRYIRDAHHYGFDVQYWSLDARDYQPGPGAYAIQQQDADAAPLQPAQARKGS